MRTWRFCKIDTGGWLDGSIRMDLTPAERGVWMDLISLASETRERDGTLNFAPGKPMSKEYIANRLRIPLDLLESTIKACKKDSNKENNGVQRIMEYPDGTLYLPNYMHYQAVPRNRSKAYLHAKRTETKLEYDARIAKQSRRWIKDNELATRNILKQNARRKGVDTTTGEVKTDKEGV